MQPDYGATRQKAGQRILGTLAGVTAGSLLLWLKMPMAWHVVLASALAFGFACFLRRNYALAVFFVTLMIVLMTEAAIPMHLDFTIERLLATLADGALALTAALLFWPKWEREQAPKIIAAALRANRTYFLAVAARLATGEPFTGDPCWPSAMLSERTARLRRPCSDCSASPRGCEIPRSKSPC